MRLGWLDAHWNRFAGPVAVLLLGIGHGVHDLLDGDSVLPTVLSSVSIALQVTVLSLGQGWAERYGWSRRFACALAILSSLFFGGLTVVLHLRPAGDPVGALGFWLLSFGVMGFWLLVFYYPNQLHQAQMRILASEAQRQKAELARLRSNLHPHFLLNTLNAVAGLLVAEPRQARQLVGILGDLLRDSLEEGSGIRTLEEEVLWLRRYAEIFEIRYRDAIHFEWDLSPAVRGVLIPRLLLQPLLENAIEHGALRRRGGGTVSVSTRPSEHCNHILVQDNGPGMPEPSRSGLGLRLVRDRLQLAHPKAKMQIDSTEQGTRVLLELPTTHGAA